jgi:hypothetical protein
MGPRSTAEVYGLFAAVIPQTHVFVTSGEVSLRPQTGERLHTRLGVIEAALTPRGDALVRVSRQHATCGRFSGRALAAGCNEHYVYQKQAKGTFEKFDDLEIWKFENLLI